MLGDNVKHYREMKKLSQAQLADMCGINPSMIGQIEACGKTPNIVLGAKIASILGVTVEQLITDERGKTE